MCSASCRPSRGQLLAICAGWNRRTNEIAETAARAGDENTLRQLQQVCLDLHTASCAMELAMLSGHGHDPTEFALLLGSVDARLRAIELVLEPTHQPTHQPTHDRRPSDGEPLNRP